MQKNPLSPISQWNPSVTPKYFQFTNLMKKNVSPLDSHSNRTAMFRMALKILWEKNQGSEKTSSVHMHEKVYPFW